MFPCLWFSMCQIFLVFVTHRCHLFYYPSFSQFITDVIMQVSINIIFEIVHCDNESCQLFAVLFSLLSYSFSSFVTFSVHSLFISFVLFCQVLIIHLFFIFVFLASKELFSIVFAIPFFLYNISSFTFVFFLCALAERKKKHIHSP